LKPEPSPSQAFIAEARFRPESHIYRVREDMSNSKVLVAQQSKHMSKYFAINKFSLKI